MAGRRLAAAVSSGASVDRSTPLRFRFDGVDYGGFAGDTLASALLANGVSLVGRSFKYHRPRGILSAGPEEPNALVELGIGAEREPNTRATTIELLEGLQACSQNRYPSLAFDLMAVTSMFARFLPAGFYYKTFMWPAAFWEKVYEPLIRRAAGLGRSSGRPDPDHYEKSHLFCDVLVVGAGPSGLAAALIAARSGARVVLCEQDFVLGGRLLADRFTVDDKPAKQWAAEQEAELRSLPNVTVFSRTAVFGVYDGNTYAAVEAVSARSRKASGVRQRLWKIVASRCVLGCGAWERPVAFGGNDRPGVMLASAVRTYVNRFAVTPGRRVCVFTTTDDGWRTAVDLAGAGVEVTAVVEARSQVDARLLDVARRIGAESLLGAEVTEAVGGRRLRGVRIESDHSAPRYLEADVLAVSGGWNPALSLTSHLGGRPRWNAGKSTFVPGTLPPGMTVVGAAGGSFALSECLQEGFEAGVGAAQAAGFAVARTDVPQTDPELSTLAPLWRSRGSRGKAFVDFQNDVTVADIELAHREGFVHLEHVKRYTTHGMATDQGKTSGLIGQAIFAELMGRSLETMGVPISRPPEAPVAIAALAGPHRGKAFRPTRRTGSHEWAQSRGAVFVEAGEWLRPQWFPQAGEQDWLACVSREVTTVRTRVGVCDVSTLGKIDIQGQDAGTFLDRVYVNTFSTLPVGKARYGLMLREDGFVLDDGTTARLGPNRYFTTTTTANAGRVMQHLQFCLQVLWPRLDVQLTSVTEQWAQYAVAGPMARAVLGRIVDPPWQLDNAAFPFLAAADLHVCGGCPARLFRISFSGELAYELSVPARSAEPALRAILTAGAEFGIEPYGTEALSVLRIEKGHVAGNEINGRTTASDLGFGRMLSTNKDFIGRVLAGRPALRDPDRPALAGFVPVKAHDRLRAGAHLFRPRVATVPTHDEGYLTSVAFSPSLGMWIGLGLLKGGTKRVGERVRFWDPVRGGDFELEVRPPAFIDPQGHRLHA